MAVTAKSTQSIVEERLLTHPPEIVWCALTPPPLIGQWLSEIGHRVPFRFVAGLERAAGELITDLAVSDARDRVLDREGRLGFPRAIIRR